MRKVFGSWLNGFSGLGKRTCVNAAPAEKFKAPLGVTLQMFEILDLVTE
jgi:hypothetical protein